MKLRYPDFLGIGDQKAGTTWLHANLRRHPAVWVPPVKELQYFNQIYVRPHQQWTTANRRSKGIRAFQYQIDNVPREKANFRLLGRIADIIDSEISDEWYGSIFSLAHRSQTCGEVSPQYSLLPDEGIEHIVRLSPGVKVILSLRDPIARNWSQIRMISQSKPNAPNVDLARIASLPEVMMRADYPAIISRWSKFVPKDRLLVLFMDDMVSRPLALMSDVCKFLGVKFENDMFVNAPKLQGADGQMDIPPEIYGMLKDQLHPVYVEMNKLFPAVAGEWMVRHF